MKLSHIPVVGCQELTPLNQSKEAFSDSSLDSKSRLPSNKTCPQTIRDSIYQPSLKLETLSVDIPCVPMDDDEKLASKVGLQAYQLGIFSTLWEKKSCARSFGNENPRFFCQTPEPHTNLRAQDSVGLGTPAINKVFRNRLCRRKTVVPSLPALLCHSCCSVGWCFSLCIDEL